MRDKLWLYTNYDCNLACTYCVAESHPRAARNALPLATVMRLVDEAVALGFRRVYFTGGEPFLLPDIYDMIAYASARLHTTVLTNGILLRGPRLERLLAVNNPRLTVQVSIDGARPEHHDPYRGAGTWQAAVDAVRRLVAAGVHVRLAATETPANVGWVVDVAFLADELGVRAGDCIARPLARRGFATEGIAVDPATLAPELTVTADGVFWHPLASPSSTDMLVSRAIFPLADALAEVERRAAAFAAQEGQPRCVT